MKLIQRQSSQMPGQAWLQILVPMIIVVKPLNLLFCDAAKFYRCPPGLHSLIPNEHVLKHNNYEYTEIKYFNITEVYFTLLLF